MCKVAYTFHSTLFTTIIDLHFFKPVIYQSAHLRFGCPLSTSPSPLWSQSPLNFRIIDAISLGDTM